MKLRNKKESIMPDFQLPFASNVSYRHCNTTTAHNLTTISQRNDGKFPTVKIYQLIDGEGAMGPHGSKEMPVWGDRYRAEAIGQMAGVPHDLSAEVIAHGRILSLVYYLELIQK